MFIRQLSLFTCLFCKEYRPVVSSLLNKHLLILSPVLLCCWLAKSSSAYKIMIYFKMNHFHNPSKEAFGDWQPIRSLECEGQTLTIQGALTSICPTIMGSARYYSQTSGSLQIDYFSVAFKHWTYFWILPVIKNRDFLCTGYKC